MATEQRIPLGDRYPDLRTLRLIYSRAIAASEAAEDGVNAAYTRRPAPTEDETEGLRLTRNLAHEDELDAGRAYMQALAEANPL